MRVLGSWRQWMGALAAGKTKEQKNWLRYLPGTLYMGILRPPSVYHEEANRVLLRQVEQARKYRKTDWLSCLAKLLDTYQFDTRDWISSHVSPLAHIKTSAWSNQPTSYSRDVSLDVDPDLERRQKVVSQPQPLEEESARNRYPPWGRWDHGGQFGGGWATYCP